MRIEFNEAKAKKLLRWYRDRGFTKSFACFVLVHHIPSLHDFVDKIWKEGEEDDKRSI